MSGQLNSNKLNEAVELVERQAGVSTRTVVPIPEQVADWWDLKYDEYVRVSVVSRDDGPALAIAPMGDLSYRERANDLKLTSSDAVALPRRLVRSFSLAGDVWWEEFDNQLVGSLMDYSDASTLYEVVSHYTEASVPREDEGPDAARRTSFGLLRDIADTNAPYVDGSPYGITTHRGSIRHYIPDDLGINEDDRAIFVLFHDGEEFLFGFLPAPADLKAKDSGATESIETITVSDAYLPRGGSIEVETLDGERIGHTDRLEAGSHKNVEVPLYSAVTEPTRVVLTATRNGHEYELDGEPIATSIALSIDGDDPEPLPDDYVAHRTGSEADAYSMRYNPLSASPYDDPQADEEKLPDIILDFEKDAVTFHRDRRGNLYYTVPKQVAACLWLEDGYMTDWLELGDLFLAQLVPESRKKARQRADPSRVPTS